jgi:hypothetical protein
MTRIPNFPQATVPGTGNECASFTFLFIYKDQFHTESNPVDSLLDGHWDFIKDSKSTEKNGSGSRIQIYGSTDPDPLDIFTDPEHCSVHSPFVIGTL